MSEFITNHCFTFASWLCAAVGVAATYGFFQYFYSPQLGELGEDGLGTVSVLIGILAAITTYFGTVILAVVLAAILGKRKIA